MEKPEIKATGTPFYASLSFIILSVFITLLFGLGYLLLQWRSITRLEDTYFVSLLVGATAFLAIALRYMNRFVTREGVGFYMYLLPKEDPTMPLRYYQEFRQSVFNTGRMTIAGGAYGFALSLSPTILDVWKDDVWLRVSLSTFLFMVNFTTGVGFYGLFLFFIHALRMGRIIEVGLWNVLNPATRFIVGASRRVAIFASFYICLCNVSIVVSILPVQGLVIGYAIFCLLVMLASLIIPQIPILGKVRDEKRKALNEMDKRIEDEYKEMVKQERTKELESYLGRIEKLLFLREKIIAIDILPYKLKSILAGTSVVIVSLIPVILQRLLENSLR